MKISGKLKGQLFQDTWPPDLNKANKKSRTDRQVDKFDNDNHPQQKRYAETVSSRLPGRLNLFHARATNSLGSAVV